ncbi:hypothetical protein EZS27_008493 [termite gut metagenome]|uniref:Methylamine utilisation protein MauE domain-containing protein n=1 Tax=termite gut metagenome TaxID=433724 RepID=A0A5J4SDS2_9ZZZZ
MRVKKIHSGIDAIVNLCRFILSGLFLFSGFVKAIDPLGSQYKVQDYLEAFGVAAWFPACVSLVFSIILSSLEFVLGVFLFFGIWQKRTTIVALLFMLVMTPFTFYLALTNLVSDCGCFGDAWVLTHWQTFWKNVFLLGIAVLVFQERKRIIRLVSIKSQGWIAWYVLPFIVILSIYCLMYLPIFDFRPYKTGVNIRESMGIPPDAKPSVYESIFILEKDGQKKEFTSNNYPDTTWTFVDVRNVLKKKGYEPPIADFSMIDLPSGEDIAEQVLTDEDYTFLLTIWSVEEADDSNIDLINELYDYCTENGYSFYGLTSSSGEQIEQWRYKTGAEYPFCLTDPIALKTMIRSNPGLMLIKNGIILNKWSDKDLPNEYVLNDRLENIRLGEMKQDKKINSIGIIIFWFVLPLLIVSGIDDLFVRRRFRRKLIEELPNLTHLLIKKEYEKKDCCGKLENEQNSPRGS